MYRKCGSVSFPGRLIYAADLWCHISVKITPVCLVNYDVGPVYYEVGPVYYEIGPVYYEVGPVYSGGARALGTRCTVHVTDADRPSTT